MCQTLGMRTCCLALGGNFLLRSSSLQMASNCFLNDLSVQSAGTWSERPFHIFISPGMRTYYIKPPFTLSKELFVQKRWWNWWIVSCDNQSPVEFLFFPGPGGWFLRSLCGPEESIVAQFPPICLLVVFTVKSLYGTRLHPLISKYAEHSRIAHTELR